MRFLPAVSVSLWSLFLEFMIYISLSSVFDVLCWMYLTIINYAMREWHREPKHRAHQIHIVSELCFYSLYNPSRIRFYTAI
jgi:hypothetical protein